MTRPARPLSRKRSTGSCGTADSRPTSRLSRYQTDALRHSGSVVFAFYPGIVGLYWRTTSAGVQLWRAPQHRLGHGDGATNLHYLYPQRPPGTARRRSGFLGWTHRFSQSPMSSGRVAGLFW